MTHDLHDLLDGAAEGALGARTLDARALLEQGRARHRRSLWRRGAAVVAVAAAVAVGLVLVPLSGAPRPAPAQPPSGPVGMPRSLPLPTPWTPTVAESPIGQASLLVDIWAPNSDWADGATLVVSADGTGYRLLPATMEEAHLTDDGRRVVYRPADDGDFPPTYPHATLHVVDLSDGKDRALKLPDSGLFSTVERLVLAPDSRTVYAVGNDGTKGTASNGSSTLTTWKVDLVSGAVARVVARPAFVASDGTTYASDDNDAVAGGLRPLPQPLQNAEEQHLVSSPDGRGLAAATPNPYQAEQSGEKPAFLVVGRGRATRLDVGVPKRHATDLLAWGAHGLLYTWDDEVRSVDPVTRDIKVVTTLEQPVTGTLEQEARFVVNDVAGWAARAGSSVPGVVDQAEPPVLVRALVQPRGGLRPIAWVLLVVAVLGGCITAWSRRRVPLPRP